MKHKPTHIAFVLCGLIFFSGCALRINIPRDNFKPERINPQMNQSPDIVFVTESWDTIRTSSAFAVERTIYYNIATAEQQQIPIDSLREIHLSDRKVGRNSGIALGIIVGGLTGALIVSADTDNSKASDVATLPDFTPAFAAFGGMVAGGVIGAGFGQNHRTKIIYQFTDDKFIESKVLKAIKQIFRNPRN